MEDTYWDAQRSAAKVWKELRWVEWKAAECDLLDEAQVALLTYLTDWQEARATTEAWTSEDEGQWATVGGS